METKKVNQLINCLTNDEDHRQELWLQHLNGNSVETFVSHLNSIAQDCSENQKVKANLWGLLMTPPSQKFYDILHNFSDFQQSIICLLMLGLTISEISGYKGLSEVRIRQAVFSIKSNKCWEEFYGIKDDAKEEDENSWR